MRFSKASVRIFSDHRVSSFDSMLLVFGMRNQILEHELDRVEEEFAVDLKRGLQRKVDTADAYYPQIEESIRREAAAMAPRFGR